MISQEYGEFIFNIIKTLEKNGYPEKKVALPLEKMYEVAHSKGLNFNKVLDFLRQKDIDHEKTDAKIIFFPKSKGDETSTTGEQEAPQGHSDKAKEEGNFFNEFLNKMNPELLKNLNMDDLLKNATDMIKNMDPTQMEKIKKMYEGMSPEQREELMKKFKDLRLF